MSKKSIFYKYFFSYLIITLIPLLVMGYIWYGSSVTQLQNEVEKSNTVKLTQVKDMIDLRLKELEETTVRITNNSKLTPYMVRNGGYRTLEAISELKNYKAGIAVVDDILLYYRNDDKIYSSTGCYSFTSFSKYVYQYENWDKESFLNTINSVNIPTLQTIEKQNPSGQVSRTLVFIYPIPLHSSITYGTVTFMIQETMLYNLVNHILGDFKGSVYILDKNNNILAQKDKDMYLDSKDLETLFANHTQGIFEINLDNQKYSVVCVKSNLSEWSFITVMPASQFLNRVIEMKNLILQVVLLVALAGLSVSLIFAINCYRPIKKLTEYLKNLLPHAAKGNYNNELDIIRHAMDTTISNYQGLQTEIDTQAPFIRNQLLMCLLRGKIKNKEELLELKKFARLEFPGEYFFVLMVFWRNNNQLSIQDREIAIQITSQLPVPDGVAYGVELIQENAVAIVVNTVDIKDIKEKQLSLASRINRLLKEYINMVPTIGIGKVYKDVLHINRSFIDASAAIEYRLVKGNEEIIFFEEISQAGESNIWYPVEEQVKLVHSLKQGDKAVALENIGFLINAIKEKDISLPMVRSICYDIINMVIKTLNGIEPDMFAREIKELLSFSSIYDLKSKLEKLTINVCDYVDMRKESRNIILRDQILDYVSSNFRDPNINLEQIAEHFNLSLSYTSRFFKEQFGYTFTEYLRNLRLAQVKKDLVHTNKPIKDIVTGVGYLDVSNFVRTFKKTEGITPGEYRKLHPTGV